MKIYIPKLFCCHSGVGFFWMRVFGRGFIVKDIRIHNKIFSERIRKDQRPVIGYWSFSWLKKEK